MPPPRGEVTITDFSPAEDRIDWSLLDPGFRCDLGVARQGQDTLLSWGKLRVRLVGADRDPGHGCAPLKGRPGR
ncbi:hypothetical protein [Paracoccus shandongensis]|uniref:hypothetical protein n=1 Tax=Paracoccus shandongensis TaxID=2816048 RepID=UPI001A8FCAD2|nr:hypothetical protein [Paracoccus shandongensis]